MQGSGYLFRQSRYVIHVYMWQCQQGWLHIITALHNHLSEVHESQSRHQETCICCNIYHRLQITKRVRTSDFSSPYSKGPVIIEWLDLTPFWCQCSSHWLVMVTRQSRLAEANLLLYEDCPHSAHQLPILLALLTLHSTTVQRDGVRTIKSRRHVSRPGPDLHYDAQALHHILRRKIITFIYSSLKGWIKSFTLIVSFNKWVVY